MNSYKLREHCKDQKISHLMGLLQKLKHQPIGVTIPADPHLLINNDVKRTVAMASTIGFEAKRQAYEAKYEAPCPYHSAFDSDINAFIVYKELNNEEGYRSGKYDAKFVNGYHVTPSKMKKDGLYFNAQAQNLQRGIPWTTTTTDQKPWNKPYGDLDN
jgi:hypothetical protein